MTAVFLKLLNMSITATWLVLAVILLRCILKKAPKSLVAAMWAAVGIRLVCPFSFKSVLSLIPSTETIPENIIYANTPTVHSGIDYVNLTVNPIISQTFSPSGAESISPLQRLSDILTVIWLVGLVAMLLYSVISCLNIYKRVRESVCLRDNIYKCDRIASPFIFGITRPKIYLPSDLAEFDAEHVIAHEKAHLKRLDHLWKPFGFALLSVYWFNPILWVAYVLLCRDIELACDEKVIKTMDFAMKRAYASALVNCSVSRKTVAACPLAFGEVGVKERINKVLNYRKPAFWIVIAAVILCMALTVCFLTDPIKEQNIDSRGITVTDVGTSHDDIKLINKSPADDSGMYVCVEWKNESEDVLCFGDDYLFYKDGNLCDPSPDYIFGSLQCVLPGGSCTDKINFDIYPLTKGAYRIEKTFYLQNEPDIKYNAFINFTLEGQYLLCGNCYVGEKVVCESGSFSSVLYTDDKMPQFMVSDYDFHLLTDEHPDSAIQSSYYDIGALEKIKLNKGNFDNLIPSPMWADGYSAVDIRENNKYAFFAEDSNGSLYYFLEQNNGDIYIAQGYSDSNSIIRWVFKMAEAGDSTNNTLREKYPQYFNLPANNGLNVYVWQLGQNSYSCVLLPTEPKEYSEESIWFMSPVSIDEMKQILLSYNLPESDINIIPISNPISSYCYEINDEYKEKLNNLFF